jgi:cyanophycinase
MRFRSLIPLGLFLASLSFCAAAFGCSTGRAVAPSTSAAASARGHLLIVGGGPLPPPVLARFVELAGGPGRAKIVLFPMASSDPDAGIEMAETFRKLGATSTRVVMDHATADTPAGAAKLDGVTGVWFGGGDQVKLTEALAGTRTEAAIRARYRDGAVIGGTSAGAAVMSTPMLTGDERRPGGDRPPPKDSPNAYMTIARENVVTVPGFALLPGAIVDQHFLRRRRNNRLVSLVLEHPDLVGVGIDESTALEVDPNGVWQILGKSVAVVYDARHAAVTSPRAAVLGASEVRMHVLPAGSRYDPRTGKTTLPGE